MHIPVDPQRSETTTPQATGGAPDPPRPALAGQDHAGEGPAVSTEPRSFGGLKVIEVEPGAEVPPGVPAWAQRCDLVKTPNHSAATRRWLIGGGAVGAAASLAALGFAPWDRALSTASLIVSLVTLSEGLWPGSRTVVTPSDTGRFLVFADGVAEPMSDRQKTVGCLASGIGVLVMLTGITALIDGDLGMAAFLGLSGWWFYRVGRTGQMEAPDLPPATPEFLALADPRSPLPGVNLPASPPQTPASTEPGSRAGT